MAPIVRLHRLVEDGRERRVRRLPRLVCSDLAPEVRVLVLEALGLEAWGVWVRAVIVVAGEARVAAALATRRGGGVAPIAIEEVIHCCATCQTGIRSPVTTATDSRCGCHRDNQSSSATALKSRLAWVWACRKRASVRCPADGVGGLGHLELALHEGAESGVAEAIPRGKADGDESEH
eukprot:6058834-Prymnesium_polylepis.1